jgi:hypothetical protein
MRVAVDFDGTIVDHQYPRIGPLVPESIEWLQKWQSHGIQLILWTMRSGEKLAEAVQFCEDHGIFFDSVNKGIGDREWTDSPKAYAHIYVDDAAFGCPLRPSSQAKINPQVDWDIVGPAIMKIKNVEKCTETVNDNA